MHFVLAYNVGSNHAGWWIPGVVALVVLGVIYLPMRLRRLRRRLRHETFVAPSERGTSLPER